MKKYIQYSIYCISHFWLEEIISLASSVYYKLLLILGALEVRNSSMRPANNCIIFCTCTCIWLFDWLPTNSRFGVSQTWIVAIVSLKVNIFSFWYFYSIIGIITSNLNKTICYLINRTLTMMLKFNILSYRCMYHRIPHKFTYYISFVKYI